MFVLLMTLAVSGFGAADSDLMNYCLVNKGHHLREDSCSCPTGKEIILDLGIGYYPRFLSSFECDPMACHPFYCTTFSYDAKVLRRREVGDLFDPTLPDSLKYNWKFVKIPIKVGCTCRDNIP